jgi:hypothetical protein
LGAALGGIAGGAISEQAAHILEKYAERGGELLSEFGVHYCYDQFQETRAHPPLEDVLREALHRALDESGAGPWPAIR